MSRLYTLVHLEYRVYVPEFTFNFRFPLPCFRLFDIQPFFASLSVALGGLATRARRTASYRRGLRYLWGELYVLRGSSLLAPEVQIVDPSIYNTREIFEQPSNRTHSPDFGQFLLL